MATVLLSSRAREACALTDSRSEHFGAARPSPRGVDATGGVVNTYTASRTATGRPIYRAIDYMEIYPGITMRLSFQGRSVKADYIVKPGADPGIIRFRYDRVTATLDDTGDLIAGEIRQPAPTVLQGEVRLPARYVIDRDGWVRFAISPHDPALPLIIDPYVITGSAYFGGGLTEKMVEWRSTLQATSTSPDRRNRQIFHRRSGPGADGVEAYVLKISPSNLQVVYATYLGGTADDRALAIAVDGGGSAYIAGQTGSSNIPALPGFNGGSTDGFVARLNASGTLQFATFLGGSGEDVLNGIAIKPDGSAWVVGETTSSNVTLYGVAYQSVSRAGRTYCSRESPQTVRSRTRAISVEQEMIAEWLSRSTVRAKCISPAARLRQLPVRERVQKFECRSAGCVHHKAQLRWSDAAI